MHSDSHYDFVILGGGLAGLTFALEVARQGRTAIVLEKEEQLGGLARTVRFGDYCFDIGGHRFHSPWPDITEWVANLLAGEVRDVVRRSRIRLDRVYIDYPLRFPNALTAFAPLEALRILFSYLKSAFRFDRSRSDVTFEDWIVRRFGCALFNVYFKPYTEKVWGIPCDRISADWASQRIRLPNLKSVVAASLLPWLRPPSALVSKFAYPPLGIGVLTDSIAEAASATGNATLGTRRSVRRVEHDDGKDSWRIAYQDPSREMSVTGTQVVSTLPLSSLLGMLPIPERQAESLRTAFPYRGLICVFLAVEGGRISNDTWTYFPDQHLVFGRTHEPINWSARMAPDGSTSLCVEVFCSEGDRTWCLPDDQLAELVVGDLDRSKFLRRGRVKQAWVLRVPHAYPMYRVGYRDPLASATDMLTRWPTLHLLGRTGAFRYLNMDAVIRDARRLAKQLCQS